MQLRIKATDYELTPAVQKYLEERVATLDKFLSSDVDLARCEIELGRAAGRPHHGANLWFCEMQVIHPGGHRIVARNNSESINGAIDDVKEEVERQLLKGKQLHQRIMRKTGGAIKRFLKMDQE